MHKIKSANNKNLIVFCLAIILLCSAIFFTVRYFHPDIADSIIIEASASNDIPSPETFWLDDSPPDICYAPGVETFFKVSPFLRNPGTYTVHLMVRGAHRTAVIEVVDTIPPSAEGCDVTLYNPTQIPEPTVFIKSLSDGSDMVSLAYKEQPDMTITGAQSVTLVLTDLGGNVTEISCILTIVHDNESSD